MTTTSFPFPPRAKKPQKWGGYVTGTLLPANIFGGEIPDLPMDDNNSCCDGDCDNCELRDQHKGEPSKHEHRGF